jgi:hypothetical protein
MTQVAKHWLRSRHRLFGSYTFSVQREDGGIAGSLVGLGYLSHDALSNVYKITDSGRRWIGA